MNRVWIVTLTAALGFLGGCASAGGEAGSAEIARGDGEAAFRGGTLRYDDLGAPEAPSAPAVVLVHGWSSGREFWHKNVGALGVERRVINLDLPGHGGSDVIDAPHTMDLYADAIAAVLDDAGVERAVLVGHSNGTPTVRQFCRRYPGRTAGLVAVDGALRNVFPSEMAEQMLARFRGPDFREFSRQMFEPMASRMADRADAGMVLARMEETPQSTIVGGLEAGTDESIWIDDEIGVPLLVINAPNPSWSSSYEAHARSLSDDAEYHVIDGASHFVMMDEPDRFNELVLGWLDRHGW